MNDAERFGTLLAVGGLMMKRKDIARQIDRQQYDLRKAITELDAPDAAIRGVDPGAKLPVLVRPARAFCGQLRVIVIDVLRTAKEAPTNRQIALGVMRERGLPTEDLKLVRHFIQKVNLSLQSMKRQGEVERYLHDDGLYRWLLTKDEHEDGDPNQCA
ncbi:MAG TPA: hypothetical protein VG943_12835 [Caulobacterales bacterium]|nr:hypothetical protein [Caulobacterales bacterium]